MPSATRGSRGRSAIPHWRVKCGNKEVYVSKSGKQDCEIWVRAHKGEYSDKLKVIPPNK